MPDEKIEVEWIGTATKMTAVLERLENKLDKQEKQLQKIGTTSKKSADMAAGSFNRLETELKENERALKNMTRGTAEFARQKRKVDALRASLTKAKGEITSAGSRMSGVFSTGIGKLGTMVAGMASFQAIVSAVVGELEKVKRLKLDAADTTRTLEQALADLGQNVGAEQIAPAREMILREAPRLGTTQEGLGNLLGIAISAGAKDLQEAMEISAATLKLTVGDASKAAALVGGTLDVASLGGSKNFEGALGQLLQVQSQVRSTNLPEFAANIGPGLAAATAKGQNQDGLTTERSLEIASVISQVLKDQTGSNTATALRQFVTRLDQFVPKSSAKLKDGSQATVAGETISAFQQTRSIDERILLMRENEGLRQQFLAKQKEGIGKVAVGEFLGGGDGRALKLDQKASAAIDSIDKAQGFFTNLSDTTKRETAQLQAERKSEAAAKTAEVRGDRDLEGTVRKIVDRALGKVNLSGLDAETRAAINTSLLTDEAMSVSPIASGISALERAQMQRTAFGAVPVGGQVSAEDKSSLQEQIKILKEMRDTLRQQQQQPVINVKAPAMRPKDNPLPAATIP